MTCFECDGRTGPGGMSYDDRSAVGICRHCGKGLCKAHGVWAEPANEFLCSHCASLAAAPRSREE